MLTIITIIIIIKTYKDAMTCYGKKTVVYRVPFLPSLHLQPKKKW